MRSAIVILALLATTVQAQSAFDLTGHMAVRGTNATGPRSWLEGGFGRLEASGGRDDITASAQLGVDWKPSEHFAVHVSGAARRGPEEFGGEDFGLVEAFADGLLPLGLDEIRLRGGLFFIPTSRENIDPNWTSPYTLDYSAINTWIGQEVRPIGLDLQWRHFTSAGHAVTTGATVFQGNDTMGTLLAWRGWTVGDRLSLYDEVLPLPPLESLQTYFFRQRDDGTTPIRDDLDGRTGYSARVRYSVPQRGNVQYTFVDNRGDRLLYDGEYAWETRFHLLGAEVGNPDGFIVLGEFMRGVTYMGQQIFTAHVEAEFEAAYLMISEKQGRNRWSARIDRFSVTDDDLTPGENSDEEGISWTLTWMFDLYDNLRLTGEFTQISGDKPEAVRSGFDASTDGRTFTAELRYLF